MRNTNKIIFSILTLSVALNIYMTYKYVIQREDEVIQTSLCNYKSITALYAINSGKINILKKMLKMDIVQLVHDYNKKIYQSSRLLNKICNDWHKYIKPYALDYIEDSNNTLGRESFDKRLIYNIDLLRTECRNSQ